MAKSAGSKLAQQRWDATTQKERREYARKMLLARWEKWRQENPEKAAASEARRAARAAKAKAK